MSEVIYKDIETLSKKGSVEGNEKIPVSKDEYITPQQIAGLSAPGTLNTNNSGAQTPNASEPLSGNINLHKVSKTGNYEHLLNKPDVPALTQRVATIEGKIPSDATQSNKMVTQADIAAFITRSVSDLVNYYTKTETYTKTEVNNIVGALNQFKYEIYPSLSSVTNPSPSVLYLIGPTGSGSDKYEEYVYANGGFVKIGDTTIDLSNYVTITMLNTALASYVTSTALATILADYATRDTSAVSGNFAKFDADGNPIDAGFAASRIHRDLGYNAAETTILLTAGETGKYVKASTRAATANPNFNISAPFDVAACSELLIKTGYNPSDNDHAALDISVISLYEEIPRTRVVQKKNSSNQPLYYEVDEEGNPTDVETTTVTPFPVFISEDYVEHRYLPNNEDRFVAIPDSGYYVANIPQSCKCVISYKPGVTDLNVVVVKHGALANLTSQIFGIYEHRVIVEAVVSLAARLEALESSISKLGIVTAGSIDSNEYTKLLYPTVLYGEGAPSAGVRPANIDARLPWDGIPVFVGQIYIDTSAASGGFYYAIGVNEVANWKNA